MDEQHEMADAMRCDDSAIMDDGVGRDRESMPRMLGQSPMKKTRSLSDGGSNPMSPSPLLIDAGRRTSKDDSNLRDLSAAPVTPRRPDFALRGLSLHVPPRDFTPPPHGTPASSAATAASATAMDVGSGSGAGYNKPAPLSPKLDHSQIYASPTNILPRRSRGLDFSRAATSLHHSTLAEQSSPDSSPTIGGGRAMNIPGRGRNDFGGPEQTSTSLWSMMGNQEKMNVSSSLGSTHALGSDSSSSSDDDMMDEDMEEGYVGTPQASRSAGMTPQGQPFGSPAMSSLVSFQQRQRPRKQQQKKRTRGSLGLGFSGASVSKSPPSGSGSHARRESISWQANQLHISGADAEDGARTMSDIDGVPGDGQRGVIRRVVTRRGNLLPKSKNFARIRAALAEESAPAESEFIREAEVVKQVREGEGEHEHRVPQPGYDGVGSTTALSSPNLAPGQDSLDDVPESDIMGDLAMGLSSSFKQHAIKNKQGHRFWETFSESGSTSGARTTPPPAAFFPRGSSSGISEDVAMDSPSMSAPPSQNGQQGPSAAEITRRINSKRRRGDDEFDMGNSFKRRAVSPGMSVHNSPIIQSPMQRDSMQWGSRPGSNGGEKAGSSAPSETSSINATTGSAPPSANGARGPNKRVGLQGMVDTNDGIMRMSIE